MEGVAVEVALTQGPITPIVISPMLENRDIGHWDGSYGSKVLQINSSRCQPWWVNILSPELYAWRLTSDFANDKPNFVICTSGQFQTVINIPCYTCQPRMLQNIVWIFTPACLKHSCIFGYSTIELVYWLIFALTLPFWFDKRLSLSCKTDCCIPSRGPSHWGHLFQR